MNKRLLACAAIVFLIPACDPNAIFNDKGVTDFGLSEDDIVLGLKESLRLGSAKASLDLGQVDGYLGNALVRIALPEDAEAVYNQALQLKSNLTGVRSACGDICGEVVDELTGEAWTFFAETADSLKIALNRGAENAAPQAVGLFSDAIVGLSFDQGRNILFGNDSLAATRYLDTTTRQGLNGIFLPIVDSTLGLVDANYWWGRFADSYNLLRSSYDEYRPTINTGLQAAYLLNTAAAPQLSSSGLPLQLETNLGQYTTAKALGGLFHMVGEQEMALRSDPIGHLQALGDLAEEYARDLIAEIFTTEE